MLGSESVLRDKSHLLTCCIAIKLAFLCFSGLFIGVWFDICKHKMSGLETKHSEVAEVPSHQQSDDNDARALHGLGYNQELTVSAVMSDRTPDLMLTRR